MPFLSRMWPERFKPVVVGKHLLSVGDCFGFPSSLSCQYPQSWLKNPYRPEALTRIAGGMYSGSTRRLELEALHSQLLTSLGSSRRSAGAQLLAVVAPGAAGVPWRLSRSARSACAR